jgi:preprotein translocase subunit YajC
MLNYLLNNTGNDMGWIVWVLMGALVVLMIVMTVIPQRKQRKRMAEMMQGLGVGDKIMTIGGFIGRIVDIDGDNYTVNVGTDSAPVHVTLIKNAIRTKMDGNTNNSSNQSFTSSNNNSNNDNNSLDSNDDSRF